MIATNHKSTVHLYGYAGDAERWISAFVVPSNAPTPLLNVGPALISPWRDLGAIVVPAKARIRRGPPRRCPPGMIAPRSLVGTVSMTSSWLGLRWRLPVLPRGNVPRR